MHHLRHFSSVVLKKRDCDRTKSHSKRGVEDSTLLSSFLFFLNVFLPDQSSLSGFFDESRLRIADDAVLGDDYLFDVLIGGNVVHNVRHHTLDDCS